METEEIRDAICLTATVVKSISVKNDLLKVPEGAYEKLSYSMEVIEIKKSLVHPQKQIYWHDGVLRLTVWLDVSGETEGAIGTRLEYVVEGLFMGQRQFSDDEFRSALKIYGGQTLYDMTRADIMHLTSSIYSSGKYVLPTTTIGDFEE